jgi:hypothetical protein
MNQSTHFLPKVSIAPQTGPLRRFDLILEDGTTRPVVLRNHVWKWRGITHDAYEVVGTTKTVSHAQVLRDVQSGDLIPADEATRQLYARHMPALAMAA